MECSDTVLVNYEYPLVMSASRVVLSDGINKLRVTLSECACQSDVSKLRVELFTLKASVIGSDVE